MRIADNITNSQKTISYRYFSVTLMGCMILSALVCYGHINGSRLFLTVIFSAFVMLCVWACCKEKIFSALLYFLPWSPLLKFYKGGISFFTVALLLSCLIFLVRNKMSLNIYQVILAALLAILTLTAKALHGNPISNYYLFFFAMLLLFPCITKGFGTLSFFELVLFFSCGIITAALSAQQVAGYQNISQYITVESYLTITRLSGYYGDPNFYSAHITACLAGVQLLLSREKERLRQIVLIIIAVLLFYCGMLSASKSFVVVTACLFLVWIPILMEKGDRGSNRLRMIVGILCAGGIFLSSSVFKELFQIIDDRFAYAANVSQLTTGRTDIWKSYFKEFSENVVLTLFGEGYTDINLYNRASHNTLIQGIYQFGLIGLPLLAAWMYFMLKNTFVSTKKSDINWKYAALMCVGVALPWMSLDIIFFDEFFLLPVFALLGVAYSLESDDGISEQSNPNL